jgi:hemoglobin
VSDLQRGNDPATPASDEASAPSLFEQLGGELQLRLIIGRFVDRVFDDPMIGFFFRRASKVRIKEKEYELAAHHLGAKVEYTGRPIRQAHEAHPITGGHFMRRRKILEETLAEFGAPDNVRQAWLGQVEALRHQVTRDSGSECTHE